jgi:hypothetical protein
MHHMIAWIHTHALRSVRRSGFNTAGGAFHYQIELVSYQDGQGKQSIMVNTSA